MSTIPTRCFRQLHKGRRSLGYQGTDPPAWWRAAPRAAWGGTGHDSGATPPQSATATALALADGTGPANFQDPRREGPRSVAKWSAPLGTKFLLFSTGQERDSVPWWSPAPRSPQAVSLSSPSQRQGRLQLGRDWPGRSWSPPRPPSFQQAPPSKERGPSAPARSPPAKP